MGGAQKSMLHPYEDLDTTFRELFGFAKTFAKGGTFKEKVDGCTLLGDLMVRHSTSPVTTNIFDLAVLPSNSIVNISKDIQPKLNSLERLIGWNACATQ